jgi:polyphosphate kinase
MLATETTAGVNTQSPNAYLNRELSWLNFARRVLALVEDPEMPLLERLKFAGIMGMLHDEFYEAPERPETHGDARRGSFHGCRKPSEK